MEMDGFFTAAEKTEIYNDAAHVLDSVKDADLHKRMSDVFGQFRAVNREWYKLVLEAERLQRERFERALIRAATEFTHRGVDAVEKNTLIAAAQMLVDLNIVK